MESPLPGGIASAVRFFFQVPQFIQIAGAIIAAGVAAVVAVWLVRRRRPILNWLLGRPRNERVAMAAGGLVLGVAAVGIGAGGWSYMQHDNGFCTGCHVMGPAFERFTASEHDSLSCHDCHQQPLTASMRQLYLWVLERPEEIGAHAPVPDAICETCHVTEEPEAWQRVASTAGHRTHLESDSSALDGVMCVTCHGVEVHRFVPVDQTCAQAGCHVDSDIQLGEMRNQTSLHCVACHQFTEVVPVLAERDSAASTLTPDIEQCLTCHEMRAALPSFNPARDPHDGTCGMCHNPHEQLEAQEAVRTCTDAGCHADWRREPFHLGTSHERIGESCTTCHLPHEAEVDASDCTMCHLETVRRPDVPDRVRNRLQRTLPFDTAGIDLPPPDPLSRGPIPAERWLGWGVGWGWPAAELSPVQVPADSFAHDQHTSLTCLNCHQTSEGHGALTFEAPRGCQICHHRNRDAEDCAACHESGELPAALAQAVVVQSPEHPARERSVDFAHTGHTDVTCTTCHVQPVTLAADEPVADCTSCHNDHHTADRDCVACHHGIPPEAHPSLDTHVACDDCHERATVAALVPDGDFCGTCHQLAEPHHPDRACTTCHMLSTPDEFRPRLMRRSDSTP